MSDHEPMTGDERRAQEAVRALARPVADPAFRARLKREFAESTIAPGLKPGTGSAMDAPGARVIRGPWFADRRTQAALAIAAAVLVVTAIALNRPAPWVVTGASGEGIAMVDGRPIPMNHEGELTAALRPGSRVRVPVGTELEITSPGSIVIQLVAGTDATIPASPGRWLGRKLRGEVRAGELRITTGPRFRGARLALSTPDAQVEVTGTTLAVICDPHGTCVCVLEGRVRVGAINAPSREMAEVERGHLRFVFNDGRDPVTEDMRPMEREKLGMLQESKADWGAAR